MEINSNNFNKFLNSKEVVLADFYSPDCGPCVMLMPTMERVEKHYANEPAVGVIKVEVDECPELVLEYNITTKPTLIFFKNGVEEKRLTGGQRLRTLIEEIETLLN
jgi:thioredoxin 1